MNENFKGIEINGEYFVYLVDDMNISYLEYREVENQKTKIKNLEWVESRCYYSSLESCLCKLKNEIVKKGLAVSTDINTLLNYLNNYKLDNIIAVDKKLMKTKGKTK